jgi:hypothetical protein
MSSRLPVNSRIVSDIARRGGNRLIDRAVADVLPTLLSQASGKTSLLGRIAGFMAVRIASRSVPGAVIVGGGLLAKAIHEKRKADRAKAIAAAPPHPEKDSPIS